MKEKINNRTTLIISKIIRWVGIFTILSSLAYLIFNLAQADSFISTWMFYMATGVSLSFISVFVDIFIKSSQKNRLYK